MAKLNELQISEVVVTIDGGTIIIIDDVEYSGTVSVDEATAQTLKQTGKAK